MAWSTNVVRISNVKPTDAGGPSVTWSKKITRPRQVPPPGAALRRHVSGINVTVLIPIDYTNEQCLRRTTHKYFRSTYY